MRLIDADDLGVGRCSKDILPAAYCAGWNGLLNIINDAPTIDAVPVVRCRECRKWNSDPDSYGRSDGPKGKCMKTFEVTSDDDFCSYGERKDGDG